MGAALADAGEPRQAIEAYDRALALQPDNASAHWNRGLARLLTGDFAGGWQDYAYRWQTGDFRRAGGTSRKPPGGASRWTANECCYGRSRALVTRSCSLAWLREVTAAGASLAVECDFRLIPLLSRSMPDIEVIPRSEIPDPRTALS